MPVQVEITAHCIAQSRVNPREMREWLNSVGAVEYPWDHPDYETRVSDAALIVGNPAKRCYKSFEVGLNPNVTRVRADWAEYLENIMRSGHGSVLEHASWTWAIEGVTRVFTAEMNRHRAGLAISEGSLRFIRFTPDGIPFWMPLSIRPHPEDTPELAHKKARSRAIFLKAFQSDGEFYEELCSIWAEELKPESKFKAKKEITSMMRRIIGMGVSTGGVWTLNLRALRHLFTMRVAAAAEEEICHAIGLVAKQMIESEPMLLGDFKQTPEGFWIPKYVKV